MSRQPATAGRPASSKAASGSQDRFLLTGRGRCIRIHDRVNGHSAKIPKSGSVADVLRTVSAFVSTPSGQLPQYPGAPEPKPAAKDRTLQKPASKQGRKMPAWVANYNSTFEHGDIVMRRTFLKDEGIWGYEVKRGSHVVAVVRAMAKDRWVLQPSAPELGETTHRNPISIFLRMKNVITGPKRSAAKVAATLRSGTSLKGGTARSAAAKRRSKTAPAQPAKQSQKLVKGSRS